METNTESVRNESLRVKFKRNWRLYGNAVILIITPILAALILPFQEQLNLSVKATRCLFLLIIMAVYWCTAALPLVITALLPLFLSPMLEIIPAKTISQIYFKDKTALMFGSLIIAYSIENTGLHRRIALSFIKIFGTNSRLLMMGFMAPTWLLSMWINNSATTAMMASILGCIKDELGQHYMRLESNDTEAKNRSNDGLGETFQMLEQIDVNGDKASSSIQMDISSKSPQANVMQYWKKLNKGFSLCVCYAATCGGIATLTGTGVNLVFYDNVQRFEEKLGIPLGINFTSWTIFALPLSFVLLIFCWCWLQIRFIGFRNNQTPELRSTIQRAVNREYGNLGRMQWRETIALVHFMLLAVLWMSRDPGGAGGWGTFFEDGYVSDATAAMLVSFSLFCMPDVNPFQCRPQSVNRVLPENREQPKKIKKLLPWKDVSRGLNWSVLFLIAGGFALAEVVGTSGLSNAIGEGLSFVSGWPTIGTIFILCLITALLTEFTSNVVVASIFLPIVGNMAIANSLNPLLYMCAVTLAASFAFMLPVATPPNAIVFGFGDLTVADMASTGLMLNIAGIALASLATLTWGDVQFHLTTPLNLTSLNLTLN